jgi:hypothetical protein
VCRGIADGCERRDPGRDAERGGTGREQLRIAETGESRRGGFERELQAQVRPDAGRLTARERNEG